MSTPAPSGLDLAAFNALPDGEAQQVLLACCSSPRWAAEVAAARPFAGVEDLLVRADAALAALPEPELDAALAGHPRIGERSASASSRHEQRGVSSADHAVLAELAEANAEYESRFGHVYLVCADGRSAEELLAALRSRLDNDPVTERRVLREELRRINRLRLSRLVGAAHGSCVTTHVLDTAHGRPASGVRVVLERADGEQLATAVTDVDGRVGSLGPARLDPGSYRLRFDTGSYFAASGSSCFFPEVVVAFAVRDGGEHHHVPLLLSPFAYSTYRGS
jgi:hydroxyisourate hydrolase